MLITWYFIDCRETVRPRRAYKYDVLNSVFQENKAFVRVEFFVKRYLYGTKLFDSVLLLERDDIDEETAGLDKRPLYLTQLEPGQRGTECAGGSPKAAGRGRRAGAESKDL